MGLLKIVLISIALVSLAMFGLATRILFKKGGQFPNTHIGGNKYLKSEGISCAQTYDKIEQHKVRKTINFKTLKLSSKK